MDSPGHLPALNPISHSNSYKWKAVIINAGGINGYGPRYWSFLQAPFFLFIRCFLRKAVFTGKDKTVAVLPFINLGADSSDEYLNDGMTEEIINQLSKITGLRVAPRSSVMKYKGS